MHLAPRHLCLLSLLFLALTFTLAPMAAADPNDPPPPGDKAGQHRIFSPGFSGYFQPMAGVSVTQSLSQVNTQNRRIDSLDQSASSKTEAFPMVLWNMGYTFSDARTRIYAGTPSQNIVEGTLLMETGIMHKLDSGAVLSASFIPHSSLIDNEVWEDPFLTGADRRETDRKSKAFRVAAHHIAGSPWTVKYGFGKQKIDNDKAGDSLIGDLTPGDISDLKREGKFYQTEVQYRFDLAQGLTLNPGFSYLKGDANGDANSFDRFRGQLTLGKNLGTCQIFGTISLARDTFDKEHPVFKETRKEWEYRAIAGAAFIQPFGLEKMMANVYTGFTRNNSNIGFYDQTAAVTAVGFTWIF